MMQRNDLKRNDFVAKRPFDAFLFRNTVDRTRAEDNSPLKVLFKGVH